MPNNDTPVNYQLMKLYIDTIPNFSGDSGTLEIFLEHCDCLINQYKNIQNLNDPINSFLLRAVIGKLSGNALMLVGSRPEIRAWTDLKNLLRLSFGDQRNLDCLVQDIIIMRPLKNESFLTFGQRIQKARSSIASKLISMNLSAEERRFQIKNYDELSLKTFIRGLTGRIQDLVRLRNPDSLELAMAYVVEEENFTLSQKQHGYIQNLNSRPNPVNGNLSYNRHNRYPKPNQYPSNNSQNNNNSYGQNNQYRNFPSQPINIHQRQNTPAPKYFTNRQVFGPQTNVFKPTGQTPRNNPEPMSTSTRNPTVQRQNFNRNHFQSTGPKNFTHQELYNIETDHSTAYENFEDSLENEGYAENTTENVNFHNVTPTNQET